MLIWTSGVAALVVLVTVGQSSDLFGSAPGGPERLGAEANQVAVVGGDTLRLGGRVVRLAGIAAPDRGQTCKGGSDCGAVATTVLASLVRDRRVDCRLTGSDTKGRPFGACEAGGADLSSAVVGSGWARAEPKDPALTALEAQARRQGAGLWAAEAGR